MKEIERLDNEQKRLQRIYNRANESRSRDYGRIKGKRPDEEGMIDE